MKKKSVFSLIIIFILLFGLSLCGFYKSFKSPSVYSGMNSENIQFPAYGLFSCNPNECNPNSKPFPNVVDVNYIKSLPGQDSQLAVFRVTNNSVESLYYSSFGSHDKARLATRQYIKFIKHEATEQELSLPIETGKLDSGETTIFGIYTSPEPFEVGFIFKLGNPDSSRQKDVRVKVSKQITSDSFLCRDNSVIPDVILGRVWL